MAMSEVDLRRRSPAVPHLRPTLSRVQRERANPDLPIALMDGAARQRYALGVQRTAGNGAMSGVARRQVQREAPNGSRSSLSGWRSARAAGDWPFR